MENNLNKLNLHNYKPLRDIVFDSLRKAIIEGDLKPGERLMEVQLAERLGVSRTPVREAIRKLELEGLVVMAPRKGAHVADVSIDDILNVLEIRASLEGLASFLAAERIKDEELANLKIKFKEFNKCLEREDIECIIQKDIEIHDIIFKAARNERLIALVDNLREQVQRFRLIYMKNFGKSTSLYEEHKNIIQAISQGNPKEARKYAEAHIKSAHKFMLKNIKDKKRLENKMKNS
ncbi:MAG: GntR family transcriptional regulator [Firmicutes bacterium]|nr:GntR family transcriptional regulator [Bacillota bacterium]